MQMFDNSTWKAERQRLMLENSSSDRLWSLIFTVALIEYSETAASVSKLGDRVVQDTEGLLST